MNKFIVKLAELSNEVAEQIILRHEREDLHKGTVGITNPLLALINKEFEDSGKDFTKDREAYRDFLVKKFKGKREIYDEYRPKYERLIETLRGIDNYEMPLDLPNSDQVVDNKLEELFR